MDDTGFVMVKNEYSSICVQEMEAIVPEGSFLTLSRSVVGHVQYLKP